MRVTIKRDSRQSAGCLSARWTGRCTIQARMNAETRQKVTAVADQLGYRPHLLARSLVIGSTMTVGVVVPDP